MLAIVVTLGGGERRLVEAQRPSPPAGPGQVVVAVKAFSLNHGEVGHALSEAEEGYAPGWDFAGVVEAAPEGSPITAGQRVVGLAPQGAWAEKVAVPLPLVAAIPDALGFEDAATLPVAGLTAAVALSKRPLAPGERLLVTAATGGVGSYALQLGRAAGARVTAFARDAASRDYLLGLGADEVAVGVEEAAALAPYDVILEGVGGALLGHALEWLGARGACVLFGDAAGDEVTTFDARRFRLGGGGLFGGTTLYGLFLAEELMRPGAATASERLGELARLMVAGQLASRIGRTAPWTEVDAVARALLARDFSGKAVLTLP